LRTPRRRRSRRRPHGPAEHDRPRGRPQRHLLARRRALRGRASRGSATGRGGSGRQRRYRHEDAGDGRSFSRLRERLDRRADLGPRGPCAGHREPYCEPGVTARRQARQPRASLRRSRAGTRPGTVAVRVACFAAHRVPGRRSIMSYGNAAQAYQANDVMGRPPEQLVVLLYEHLLVNLRRSALQIHRGDIEGKTRSLGRASDIVFELLSALDREKGGELASRLAALYGYFISEISQIGRTLDQERLARLISIVASLHTSWIEAAKQVAAGRQEAVQ